MGRTWGRRVMDDKCETYGCLFIGHVEPCDNPLSFDGGFGVKGRAV